MYKTWLLGSKDIASVYSKAASSKAPLWQACDASLLRSRESSRFVGFSMCRAIFQDLSVYNFDFAMVVWALLHPSFTVPFRLEEYTITDILKPIKHKFSAHLQSSAIKRSAHIRQLESFQANLFWSFETIWIIRWIVLHYNAPSVHKISTIPSLCQCLEVAKPWPKCVQTEKCRVVPLVATALETFVFCQ